MILEQSTSAHTPACVLGHARREGWGRRWGDNGAGVFSPVRFRDGDILSVD